MLLVPGWGIFQPDRPGQVFVASLILLVAVLMLVSTEWARRGLLVVTSLMIAAMGIFVFQVGESRSRTDALNLPLAIARTEFSELQTKAIALNIEAQESHNDAVTAALRAFPTPPDAYRLKDLSLRQLLRELDRPPDDNEDFKTATEDFKTATEELKKITGVQAYLDSVNSAYQVVTSRPKLIPSTAATAPMAALIMAEEQAGFTCALPLRTIGMKEEPVVAAYCDYLPSGPAHVRDQVSQDVPAQGDEHEPLDDLKLRQSLHKLKVELATYRATVAPSDAAAAAVTAAINEPFPSVEVSFDDALANGPSGILTALFNDNRTITVPGVAGWALFLLALLAFLRFLLQRNDRQIAGPVEEPSYAGKNKADFRIALLQNVPTPAAAPGAELQTSITDLATAVAPTAGVIGKLLGVVSGILALRSVYIVDLEVSSLEEAEKQDSKTDLASNQMLSEGTKSLGTETTVMVRVTRRPEAGGVLITKFTDTDPRTAVQSAGLWAAGVILERSTRIPSWATWNRDTAVALAQSQDSQDCETLRKALRGAPNSGILLQRFGAALESEGRSLEAIAAYARAVANHPRYFTARYRLAAAIGSRVTDSKEAGQSAITQRSAGTSTKPDDPSIELQIKQFLTSALKRLGLAGDVFKIDAVINANPCPATARELADSILNTLVKDTGRLQLIVAALRRSDRTDLWAYLFPLSRWNNRGVRIRMMAESALYNESKTLNGAFSRYSADPRCWWQVPYNLACSKLTKPWPWGAEVKALNEALSEAKAKAETAVTAVALKEAKAAAALNNAKAVAALNNAKAVAAKAEAGVKALNKTLSEAKAGAEKAGAEKAGAAVLKEAMEELEKCLLRPGVYQLTKMWALQDPDLKRLKAGALSDRFMKFAELLPGGDKVTPKPTEDEQRKGFLRFCRSPRK